ncbi:MAG: 2-phosphosulfolactate phosphatase [Oscillospiraceae bacterium]|jgi:2-phosphosulfolactate phosphatase|nr:2-phosphosulfolactate phosphatase [Oscillospiraceae bacterium]
MDVFVYDAPAQVPDDLRGLTAVVIDTLRMTSVATIALANGCAGLLAVREVEEARVIAAAQGALLGGERGAVRIEGFDFANSPLEYTPERVQGRRIVMTTSNGTAAIARAVGADKLFLGAMMNAGAVARVLRDEKRVALVCAGTLGEATLEDTLTAGAILARMEALGVGLAMDDGARTALAAYRTARGDLHGALRGTSHYERLRGLGLEEDLRVCLREDWVEVVPVRGADGWFGAGCF